MSHPFPTDFDRIVAEQERRRPSVEGSRQVAIRKTEKRDDYREELAALCHEQWSGWTDYLLGKGRRNEDGSVTLSAGYVVALNRLIHMAYADLSEAEKDNDRTEADRILALR